MCAAIHQKLSDQVQAGMQRSTEIWERLLKAVVCLDRIVDHFLLFKPHPSACAHVPRAGLPKHFAFPTYLAALALWLALEVDALRIWPQGSWVDGGVGVESLTPVWIHHFHTWVTAHKVPLIPVHSGTFLPAGSLQFRVGALLSLTLSLCSLQNNSRSLGIPVTAQWSFLQQVTLLVICNRPWRIHRNGLCANPKTKACQRPGLEETAEWWDHLVVF